MPGTRYTKLGIVCIVSRIGLIIVLLRLLRAASTPNGIPKLIAIVTATNMIATVTMVGSHRLTEDIAIMPMTDPMAIFAEASLHAVIAITPIIIGQGTHIRKSRSFPSTHFKLSLITSKNHPNSIIAHVIELSIAHSSPLDMFTGKSRASSNSIICVIIDSPRAVPRTVIIK